MTSALRGLATSYVTELLQLYIKKFKICFLETPDSTIS